MKCIQKAMQCSLTLFDIKTSQFKRNVFCSRLLISTFNSSCKVIKLTKPDWVLLFLCCNCFNCSRFINVSWQLRKWVVSASPLFIICQRQIYQLNLCPYLSIDILLDKWTLSSRLGTLYIGDYNGEEAGTINRLLDIWHGRDKP